jgi:Undecaprenyl-phosphate glucose phosphotransferase
MRAATPKADNELRPSEHIQDAEAQANAPLPGSGVTPLRAGRAGEAWPPNAANDVARIRPAPLPALAIALLVGLLDLFALAGAGMAADALTGAQGAHHIAATLLIAGLTIGFGSAGGAYDHAALFHTARQLRRIGAAALGAVVATIAAAAAFGAWHRVGPHWLAAAVPLGMLSLCAGRAAVAGLLRNEAGARAARRSVVVGAGPQADRLAAALRRDPGGLELIGLVEDRATRSHATPAGVPPLGGLPVLFGMIRRDEVDVVLLAVPWAEEARLTALIERLSAFPVEIHLAPDLAAAQLPPRAGLPVTLPLRRRPISGLAALAKRAEDLALAGCALAVAAVPMLLIVAAVKLDSPGPVLFRQRRTGFNDRPFEVLKFRTMYHDAADPEASRQVLAGDPRVTRVGAILRRTSLDELPQIFNVLRGEMSFIGPRPHAPGTRAGNRRFDEVVANYAARHRVKPGLTGLAQVRGWRGPTLTEEQIIRRVESDLEYIERWSLGLDAWILLRTLLAVARMRNAL